MMSDEDPQEKVRERLVSEGQDHAFGAGGGGLGGTLPPQSRVRWAQEGCMGPGALQSVLFLAVCREKAEQNDTMEVRGGDPGSWGCCCLRSRASQIVQG